MNDAVTTPAQDSEESTNWRSIPQMAVLFGFVLCVYGLVQDKQQFAFSYLTAFMFFLSLGLGSLFMVLVHHLFDAGWSSPIRRYLEHFSCLLFPWMGLAFVPIGFMAPEYIYPWMQVVDPHDDHALYVKKALFNKPTWYAGSVIVFLFWGWLTHRLRYWSLQQDKAGTPERSRHRARG